MNTSDLTIPTISGLSARGYGPSIGGQLPYSIQRETTPLRAPLRQLGVETMHSLRDDFAHKHHHPSEAMWGALADIIRTLENMADGVAEDSIHLASLDPGVGKTQSVVHFLPVLLRSRKHLGVGVLICANRISQIKAMIADAKAAGLRDEYFAVYTSDATQNARGRGIEDRHNARVLFSTHAMVMKRCEGGRPFSEASDFHYQGHPRQVRVWDEAIIPGLGVTLNNKDLSSLISPVFPHNAKLSNEIGQLFSDLRTQEDGSPFTIPDLPSECGFDLNDLEGMFEDHKKGTTNPLKATANALWFLCGKTVTVRKDGKFGHAILDYEEILPPDLAPLLVLDASSRRNVRETYNLWASQRGGIKRLIEAPKDYSPLTIHHWAVSGGKSAFRARTDRERRVKAVALTINSDLTRKWLVVHHKDPDFEADVRALLNEGAETAFIHWGAHDATNDYKDRSHVILAGTLFLRPSQYEALGRAAARLPSSDGPFPKKHFEATRRGEHRHLILQAACRGLMRKCDGASCPPSHLYIIASRPSGIANDLPNLFPGAHIVRWQPIEKKLTGKVGMAANYIIENAQGGSFVSDADVMRHLGMSDRRNYRKRIKKNEDLLDALSAADIEMHRKGRRMGFQKSHSIYFGDTE